MPIRHYRLSESETGTSIKNSLGNSASLPALVSLEGEEIYHGILPSGRTEQIHGRVWLYQVEEAFALLFEYSRLHTWAEKDEKLEEIESRYRKAYEISARSLKVNPVMERIEQGLHLPHIESSYVEMFNKLDKKEINPKQFRDFILWMKGPR